MPTDLTSPLAAQTEIWISAQMGEPQNCAFNLSYSLRLLGDLNISILRSALQQLIDRHEALRMIFSRDENNFSVIEFLPLSLQVFDLAELDLEAKVEQLAAILGQEVSQSFQLEGSLLFRAKLVKLDLESHQLILTAHQLICDNRSWRVIINDLGQIYSALLARIEPNLPLLTIEFSQYAIATAAAVEQPAEQYWLEQFSQSIPILDLPTDRPRPRQRTFDAGCEVWQLSPEIAGGLQDLATRLDCELKTLLLASWEIWIYRLTGQDDVVVGVPADGTVKFGCPDLVGNCVNLLPIRSRIDGTRPFRHYLDDRSLAVSAAYAHQEFSLGSLIGKLPLKRDASRLPLVSILFDVDRGLDVREGAFEGLVVECFANPQPYENFELSMKVTELSGGLTLTCQYNSNLFDRVTIGRRLAEFETLLGGIVANPNCPIDLLPLLPAAELELLDFWNQTAISESIPQGGRCANERTIHELFIEQAEQTPDRLAVIFGDRQLTYQQLDRQSNRYAHHLQALGVTAGSVVGISLERSIDTILAMLGVLKAGGAYVPLDPSYPQHRLAYKLADSQATILITQAHLLDLLPIEQVQMFCVDRDAEILNTYPTDRPTSLVAPTDLAYIIYTSGSTGNPKGVQIEHRSAVNFLTSMQNRPGLTAQDTLLSVASISFDMSILDIFLPLSVGATLLIVSREVTTDGERLSQILNASGTTAMQATPATWRLLLASNWQGSPPLKIYYWSGVDLYGICMVPRKLRSIRRSSKLSRGMSQF
jgi:non-ribosomal peptide synthetase component F